MARAMDSICFCPPDSVPAGDFQKVFSGGKTVNVIYSGRCHYDALVL